MSSVYIECSKRGIQCIALNDNVFSNVFEYVTFFNDSSTHWILSYASTQCSIIFLAWRGIPLFRVSYTRFCFISDIKHEYHTISNSILQYIMLVKNIFLCAISVNLYHVYRYHEVYPASCNIELHYHYTAVILYSIISFVWYLWEYLILRITSYYL